mmetsp:Transcript_24553/g.54676  ORF Transcript_24553/g.54676 Transcript_24553/m.54676 type:complete len:223 (+) Transcript_24553:886-1554(+)
MSCDLFLGILCITHTHRNHHELKHRSADAERDIGRGLAHASASAPCQAPCNSGDASSCCLCHRRHATYSGARSCRDPTNNGSCPVAGGSRGRPRSRRRARNSRALVLRALGDARRLHLHRRGWRCRRPAWNGRADRVEELPRRREAAQNSVLRAVARRLGFAAGGPGAPGASQTLLCNGASAKPEVGGADTEVVILVVTSLRHSRRPLHRSVFGQALRKLAP